MQSHFTQANGIKIHYITEGSGPPLLLLHGFPEFWYAWRYQIPVLAKHFQVIVPDLRGYNETEKPLSSAEYAMELLVEDAVGLLQTLGHPKAHIVGHDWGGAIAWQLALRYPERVDRLAVLNCPHPALFAAALKSNWAQIRKSWYIFFFQLPYLPEYIFKVQGKKILERLFKQAISEEDIQKYWEALQKPHAFTCALNYYRAAFRKSLKKPTSKKIAASTLLIWGEKDVALGKELTYAMEPLFSGKFTVEYIPDCGHFVNEEQPEVVNRLLLQHLL